MQNLIRLFIWDPISTLVGAYKIKKCIPKVFLPHEILWSISPIGVFPNEYSLNISRQRSKPFWFLKCPALRWSGECSNCFVRVATSACYGHVMHTSLGARFSVAGQRFVVEFFRLSEDVMLNHERNHHGLPWKTTGRFTRFSGNKTKAWPVTKKGASPEKMPQKNSGDSVPLRDWRHVEFRDSFRCLTLRWFLVEIL